MWWLWLDLKCREASHIDFVHEKRHMDVFLETPPPPFLEASRTFFDTTEALEALFIVQALRLGAVYKSIFGARPGPNNEHTNII